MTTFNKQVIVKEVSLLLRNQRAFLQDLKRVSRPMPQPYRDRLDMTLPEWLVYH